MKNLLLVIILFTFGCSPDPSVSSSPIPKRYYSIIFQNVPFESINNFSFTYGSVTVDSFPMLESRGPEGTRKSYWVNNSLPKNFHLKITYNNGKQVDKKYVIPETVFNRFGISNVVIDYAESSHNFSYEYGIVSHANDDLSLYFDKVGNLERIWKTFKFNNYSISKEYKNFNGTILNSLTSYVNKEDPYIYIRKDESNKILEIESFHHNHPKNYRVKYNESFEIISATYTEYQYRPGGLRKSSTDYPITNFDELKALPKPDISFNSEVGLNIKKFLEQRNLKLKPSKLKAENLTK